MKIKTKEMSYEDVLKLKKAEHKAPTRPWLLLQTVIRLLAIPDMLATKFKYTFEGRDKLEKGPYLILMNHSSFIDLKIASKIFYPMPYSIVCTSDGFVGKDLLMRLIGCIPTQKFVTDMTLIKDMRHVINKKKVSILMYPEASYTFDGTVTPLPQKLGQLMKLLNVPVITVITNGAFHRDPLYNGLQLRKVNVSATVKCIATREDIKNLSVDELTERLEREFTFDNFRWQQENNIRVAEPFRADGLERILYKCASCGVEGKMVGKGTTVKCNHCGKEYELTEYGKLKALDGVTEFEHIPDWYAWQRQCVRTEIERGEYLLDTDVLIGMLVDHKAIYMIGKGHLTHTDKGFCLTGADGALNYTQAPHLSYSLYSDYFWYEIGDVISIGDKNCLYYFFPEKEGTVAKTRLAAEELFKMQKNSK